MVTMAEAAVAVGNEVQTKIDEVKMNRKVLRKLTMFRRRTKTMKI